MVQYLLIAKFIRDNKIVNIKIFSNIYNEVCIHIYFLFINYVLPRQCCCTKKKI